MKSVVDVSVVVPCYGCTDTIERAVASVSAQTCRPLELILVNDASLDETAEYLQRLHNQHPEWLHVVNLIVNVGAGEARNAGWAKAKGRYIAFLDSDDSWHPKKLEIQYAYMQAHPDVYLTGHAHANALDAEVDGATPPVAKEVQMWHMLAKNPFVTPSAMVRKDLVLRFQKGRRYMEDHLLWMEISLKKGRVVRLQVSLAILHKAQVGESGLSNDISEMSKADLGNYLHLYRKGLLKFPLLILCWMWVSLKFLRRALMFGIPRAWKRCFHG